MVLYLFSLPFTFSHNRAAEETEAGPQKSSKQILKIQSSNCVPHKQARKNSLDWHVRDLVSLGVRAPEFRAREQTESGRQNQSN